MCLNLRRTGLIPPPDAAGWTYERMLERYSHTRTQAKREAVGKLPIRRPPIGTL
jgi:hypothetical protein